MTLCESRVTFHRPKNLSTLGHFMGGSVKDISFMTVQRHLSTLRPISCNPQTLIPSMHCKICTSQKVRPRRRNPCQKHDVYLMASIWQVSRRCRSRYGVDKVIAGEMDLGLAASISACVILEIHEKIYMCNSRMTKCRIIHNIE